jgi:hypothetical protein
MDNFQQMSKQWVMLPLNQVMKMLPPTVNRITETEIVDERLQICLQEDHETHKDEWDSRASKLHIESMFVWSKLPGKPAPTSEGQPITLSNS